MGTDEGPVRLLISEPTLYPNRDIGRFGGVILFENTGFEIPEADLLSGCVLNPTSLIHVGCE